MLPRDCFRNAYELLNLRPFKISPLYEYTSSLTWGQDVLCGISKKTFEIPHKITCPYIETYDYCEIVFKSLYTNGSLLIKLPSIINYHNVHCYKHVFPISTAIDIHVLIHSNTYFETLATLIYSWAILITHEWIRWVVVWKQMSAMLCFSHPAYLTICWKLDWYQPIVKSLI